LPSLSILGTGGQYNTEQNEHHHRNRKHASILRLHLISSIRAGSILQTGPLVFSSMNEGRRASPCRSSTIKKFACDPLWRHLFFLIKFDKPDTAIIDNT
jgi:hypothetical protein